MDSKDVRRILENVAERAQQAADEASRRAREAGQNLSERYDAAKLRLLLAKARAEQDRVFVEMGRTLFLANTGLCGEADEEMPKAQQTIDRLLIAAEQKQQEMDRLLAQLREADDGRYCPVCGRKCDEEASYCAGCGAHLDD